MTSETAALPLPAVRRVSWPRVSPTTWVAAVMLLLALAVAFVVPLLPGFDPYSQALGDSLLPPLADPAHLLGTDALGRDLLSRIAAGTRVSLLIAVCAVAISSVLGLALGLLAGYRGGRVEQLVMAAGDIQLAVPVLLLLIVMVAAVGPSALLLVLLLGVTNWVSSGRVARSVTLTLREQDFVSASRAAGGGTWWVMTRHLLPNVLPQVAVLAAFDIGVVITVESSLSFIGLGVQPPTPSLGLMISEGQRYLQTTPTLTILPGLMIFLVIGGVQFLSQSVGARRSR
ncbi:MAG: ABC transporter permease [Cellulomonadaceae bacterium]|nr:ABC transporter permease [Cellulomonadaceae bacterium]